MTLDPHKECYYADADLKCTVTMVGGLMVSSSVVVPMANEGDEASTVDLLHLRNCESACVPGGKAADALMNVGI